MSKHSAASKPTKSKSSKVAKSAEKATAPSEAPPNAAEDTTKITQDPTTQDDDIQPEPAPPSDSMNPKPNEDDVDDEAEEQTPPEPKQDPIVSDLEEDEEKPNGPGVFTLSYWDAQRPSAQGEVAKRFTRDSFSEQCRKAEALFSVQSTGSTDIELDRENWTPCILAVPGSFRRLRVVYGVSLHTPSEGSGQDSEEDTNTPCILALYGEHELGVSLPKAMRIPVEALKGQTIFYPTGRDFRSKRLDPKYKSKASWYSTSTAKKTIGLPSLLPVPPALVYDSFGKDIEAMVLYERWMVYRNDVAKKSCETLDLALRLFLRGQTVNPKAKNKQGQLELEVFLDEAPDSASAWKKEQLRKLGSTSNPPAEPMSFAPTNLSELTKAMVFADREYQARKRKQKDSDSSDDSSIDEAPPKRKKYLGMAKSRYEVLVGMHGLAAGEDDEMRDLWTELCQANMTKEDKRSAVRSCIETHVKYGECRVKTYNTMLNMVANRAFEEDLSSCTKTAVRGLTVFAVPALTDDAVQRINEHTVAMETASSVTVKEAKEQPISISIPSDLFALTRKLKRFANLIYALFGNDCPLLIQLEYLISDLQGYSDMAISGMSKQTIASILWAVHCQSRHFSAGKMNPDRDERYHLVPTFFNMLTCVRNIQPVVNGDVPPSLFSEPKPNSTASGNGGGTRSGGSNGDRMRGGGETDITLSRKVKNEHYHPLLREKMKPFIVSGQKLPRLGFLCNQARCQVNDLFPKQKHKNLCIKATLYGTCFSRCNRDHIAIADDDAQHVVNKFKRIIEDPNLILNKVNN